MTDPHEEQRTDKRETHCEVVIPPPLPPREPERPEIPCTPDITPKPDVFFTPTPTIRPPTVFTTVPAVLVGPDVTEASCLDLSDDPDFTGSVVTLGSTETIKREFAWQDIPGITDAQLRFIGELPAIARNAIAIVTWNAVGVVTGQQYTITEIANIFQLLQGQATYVRTTVAALAAEAWQASKERAVGRLTCAFLNTTQTATCDGTPLTSFEGSDLVTTYTVPAGTYGSPTSVEEANTIALIAAQAKLSCMWGNVVTTRRCSQLPGNDATQEADYETVEAATSPEDLEHTVFLVGKPERIVRKLEATVAANSIVSSVSQADANSMAEAEAFSRLICFFTAATIVGCPLDPDLVPSDGPVADVYRRIKGRQATVPAGLTVSTVSQADAVILASLFGESLLNCYWDNQEMTVACDDDPAEHIDFEDPYDPYDPSTKLGPVLFSSAFNKSIEMRASSDRGIYSVLVEAGEIASDVGRADANAQALILGMSQLNCIYCNPEIPPVCVPDYEGGDILPLAAEDLGGSLDATAGVPGVVYVLGIDDILRPEQGVPFGTPKVLICTPEAAEALAVADTVGMIPAASAAPQDRECRYGNEELVWTCAEAIDPLPTYVLHSTSLAKTVTVPANQFTVVLGAVDAEETPAEAIARANQQARILAETLLACEFGNPRLIIMCGANGGDIATMELPTEEEYATGVTDAWVGNGNFGEDNDPVASISNGSSAQPIIIPRDAFRTSAGWMEAVEMAFSKAEGYLNCFFVSTQIAYCESKPDDRPYMLDGRVNTALWHDMSSIDIMGYGQVALFKYAGEVAWDYVSGKRLINPGIDPGQATQSTTGTASQIKTDQEALQIAQSKLDCTHINWPRDRYRCPRKTDILYVTGAVTYGEVESMSTRDANIQAEQIAKDRMVCEECAPFRLTSYDNEYESVVRFCHGSAIFWSITAGSGFGAKLAACMPEPRVGIKKIYWMTCGTALPDNVVAAGSNRYLFWLKLMCCEGETPNTPVLILIREDASYTNEDFETPGFYPTAEAETKAADTEASWHYVGAVSTGLSDSFDGRQTAIYQHADENLQIAEGGGGVAAGAFWTMIVDGDLTYLQGGTVGAGEGGGAVANQLVLDAGELPDGRPAGVSEGDVMWLECITSAILDEAGTSMVPGVILDSYSVQTGSEGTVPENEFPGLASTGLLVIELGRWGPTTFYPAAPGSILITGCIGSYDVNRV